MNTQFYEVDVEKLVSSSDEVQLDNLRARGIVLDRPVIQLIN